MAATGRYAITFGETAIYHVGGEEVGAIADSGFSVDELRALQARVPGSRLVMVSDTLPLELRAENEAAVLHLPGSVLWFGADPTWLQGLLNEQMALEYDKKYWDCRRQKTLNKQARYNTVFGEHDQAHSADYRKPTVHSFGKLPHLRRLRDSLPSLLGDKARGLFAEGNHYYKPSSYIGFHGDAERKKVICLSLGSSHVLRYHWRLPGSSEHTFQPVDIPVQHGDIYIMSEKATGFDWKKRSLTRVVHAAASAH